MKELKDLKLKKITDLASMSKDELKIELKEVQKKNFALKMKLEQKELKQTHLIKFLRRYIARIKTISSKNDFNIG
ncbi:50S ribosomal protein L29 [Candidatus Gracilibacteria bacterium]|nr:MAG: 50S ribosomal protein L29 [Candidatus Gracilibacteria bacterium]PIE85737.1 MAG: 50S ribosomal protein L29 [Candidatus Gracilibacteria bacterium]